MPPIAAISDTLHDADKAQFACFRRLTPQQRLQKMLASSRRSRDLALAAIRRGAPGISDAEVLSRLMAIET